MRQQHGLTLVELLATVAIAAVLMLAAIPGMQRLIDQTRADTSMRTVIAGVHYARAVAVTLNRTAVLCPLDADDRCDGDWSSGFAVFTEGAGLAERHSLEPVLRHFDGVPKGATLRFRAFGTTRYLRMLPNGQTGWQNGRFEYCPPAGSSATPRVVVVNVQGRARMMRPEDIDPERTTGANRRVVC